MLPALGLSLFRLSLSLGLQRCLASRIFSSRPSRKANSSGNSSPRLSLP